MTAKWVLFQRDDCHLCDVALEELATAGFPDFESVFVDDDASLEERWGMHVPVIFHSASETHLNWPFTAEDLRRFLETHAGTDRNVVRNNT